MWPNPQKTADFATFTEEILDGKLHFLCSVKMKSNTPWVTQYTLDFKILTLFFEVFFGKQLFLKGRQICCQILVVEFIFWQSCT